ncbi:MAG TPA: DUF4384 domain-containing protein [Candidatus Acidoferrales bacterium]|nr:DUF4384 domain-containing protein [Candidatus Acidoferrales bacterium]
MFPIIFAAVAALAQEESVRQLWNTEFLQKRPAAKTAVEPNRISYRRVADAVKPETAGAPGLGTMLGVTLWRLRLAKPADAPGTRLLVIEPAGDKRDMIPERVEANTELAEGDHVRLTVEVPHTGYLYVIDREQYHDGAMSAPFLIYPNRLTRPGDNAVAPGRLIEIPDQRDNPNHFTVKPSHPGQRAEVLSLLVMPEPWSGLKIGNDPLKLDAAVYADLEKKWTVQAERFELNDGAGKAWTDTEKRAGADGKTKLTQDDAPPQTLYRVKAQSGNPFLLQVPLRMKQ